MSECLLINLDAIPEDKRALFATILELCNGQEVAIVAEVGMNLVYASLDLMDREDGRGLVDAIKRLHAMCEMKYEQLICETAVDPHGRRLN